jgi:hypothetical protein
MRGKLVLVTLACLVFASVAYAEVQHFDVMFKPSVASNSFLRTSMTLNWNPVMYDSNGVVYTVESEEECVGDEVTVGGGDGGGSEWYFGGGSTASPPVYWMDKETFTKLKNDEWTGPVSLHNTGFGYWVNVVCTGEIDGGNAGKFPYGTEEYSVEVSELGDNLIKSDLTVDCLGLIRGPTGEWLMPASYIQGGPKNKFPITLHGPTLAITGDPCNYEVI